MLPCSSRNGLRWSEYSVREIPHPWFARLFCFRLDAGSVCWKSYVIPQATDASTITFRVDRPETPGALSECKAVAITNSCGSEYRSNRTGSHDSKVGDRGDGSLNEGHHLRV